MRSTSAKINHYKHGLWAEYLAALYLILKGYRIKAMRYKTKVGEVDIIARKRHIIAFIEVKYRPSIDECLNAVTPKSQARIRRAAEYYLLERSCKSDSIDNKDLRLDVVAITSKLLIRHIKNAF